MIHHNKSGFTLIELMLSMSFIGVLLIAIAMTSMQIMSTYAKGLTIREVNQAGRLITDDIQRTIAASSLFDVSPVKTGDDPDQQNSKYVVQTGGGRLCTGVYTYAWNYGHTRELSDDPGAPLAYNTYTSGEEVIRFVRVNDMGGALCLNMNDQIPATQAKELLPAGDRNLAIQQFTVSEGKRDEASGQALYAFQLVLGTNDQEQLSATSTNCLPPSEGSGDDDFCAINQFDIIVRAGNRAGSL